MQCSTDCRLLHKYHVSAFCKDHPNPHTSVLLARSIHFLNKATIAGGKNRTELTAGSFAQPLLWHSKFESIFGANPSGVDRMCGWHILLFLIGGASGSRRRSSCESLWLGRCSSCFRDLGLQLQLV